MMKGLIQEQFAWDSHQPFICEYVYLPVSHRQALEFHVALIRESCYCHRCHYHFRRDLIKKLFLILVYLAGRLLRFKCVLHDGELYLIEECAALAFRVCCDPAMQQSCFLY